VSTGVFRPYPIQQPRPPGFTTGQALGIPIARSGVAMIPRADVAPTRLAALGIAAFAQAAPPYVPSVPMPAACFLREPVEIVDLSISEIAEFPVDMPPSCPTVYVRPSESTRLPLPAPQFTTGTSLGVPTPFTPVATYARVAYPIQQIESEVAAFLASTLAAQVPFGSIALPTRYVDWRAPLTPLGLAAISQPTQLPALPPVQYSTRLDSSIAVAACVRRQLDAIAAELWTPNGVVIRVGNRTYRVPKRNTDVTVH